MSNPRKEIVFSMVNLPLLCHLQFYCRHSWQEMWPHDMNLNDHAVKQVHYYLVIMPKRNTQKENKTNVIDGLGL